MAWVVISPFVGIAKLQYAELVDEPRAGIAPKAGLSMVMVPPTPMPFPFSVDLLLGLHPPKLVMDYWFDLFFVGFCKNIFC